MDHLLGSDQAEFAGKLIWHTGFNDELFDSWLDAFSQGRLSVSHFSRLHYGRSWKDISHTHINCLLRLLQDCEAPEVGEILVTLLDDLSNDTQFVFDDELVFSVVCRDIHFKGKKSTMHGYHWGKVCEKLIARSPETIIPLLGVILDKMVDDYSLSYDYEVRPLAYKLCEADPVSSWEVVSAALLSVYPKRQGGIMNWLKGGLRKFDKDQSYVAISIFPLQTILDWIDVDVNFRASLIAYCVPGTLDEVHGGLLPVMLLEKYSNIRGVTSGISCNFYSGLWCGPASQHYRKIREHFYGWLKLYTHPDVRQWIEDEIRTLDQQIESEEIDEEREDWRH